MLPLDHPRSELRLGIIAALGTLAAALFVLVLMALFAIPVVAPWRSQSLEAVANALAAIGSVGTGWSIALRWESRRWRQVSWMLLGIAAAALVSSASTRAGPESDWGGLLLWLIATFLLYLVGTTRGTPRVSTWLLGIGFALQTAWILLDCSDFALAGALEISPDALAIAVSVSELAFVQLYFLGLLSLALVTVLDPRELLWRRVAVAVQPAERIHAIHDFQLAARILDGARFNWGEVYSLSQCWPLLRLVFACIPTLRNGGYAKALTGKSLLRQLFEQRCHARHGIPPTWYYVFELYLDRNGARAGDYVTRRETKHATYRLLSPAKPAAERLNDKLLFHDVCNASGLPCIPVLATFENGHAVLGGPEQSLGPVAGLFVKPRRGKGGFGAERWDRAPDGRLRGGGGETLSPSELWQRLLRRSVDRPLLAQPRLVNHAGVRDLSNGALGTVRAVTCRNDAGEFEVAAAVFRMAWGRNCVVDNIHAGGLAAPIELESGRLGLATDLGKRPGRGRVAVHPDTGGRIAGRVLPRWPEVTALARAAHQTFPERTIVGWDIAITDDGPILVEGNGQPCVDLIQRPHARPLGEMRLGELLAARMLEAAERLAAELGLATSPRVSPRPA